MKTKSKSQKNRRFNFQRTQRRFKLSVMSLFKNRRRKSARPAAERPRRRRSREDQITIDVLRYRVDHLNAMIERDDGAIYTDAFKNFLLNRYESEGRKLTRRQFARAAEIPVATLRVWVAQARRPLLAELEALEALAAGIATAAPGLREVLSERAKRWVVAAVASLIRTPKDPRILVRQIKLATVSVAHFLAALFVAERVELWRSVLKKNHQTRLAMGLVSAIILSFTGMGTYLYLNRDKEQGRQVVVRLVNYPELAPEKPEPEKEEPKARTKRAANSERPLNIVTEGTDLVQIRVLPPNMPNLPGSDLPANTAATEVPAVDMVALNDPLAHQPGISPDGGGAGARGVPLSSNIVARKGAPELEIGSGASGGAGGMGGGLGITSPAPKLPSGLGGVGVNGQGFNPKLAISSGGGGGVAGGGYATGRTSGIRGHKAVGTQSRKINVKNFSDADVKKVHLGEVFVQLSHWLKENHAELSPALKRYFDYKSGDLTAKVSLTAGAENYDLFFLCNEQSQDFGLLIVTAGDSADATFLRDSGFRKTSYALFRGIAGRDEEGEVVSMSMLEQKPTQAETSKFYNIFLSWWEANKPK